MHLLRELKLKLSALFLRHLVLWPSTDIRGKVCGDRPRGTPPSGALNSRGVAIAFLDLSKAIYLGNGAR